LPKGTRSERRNRRSIGITKARIKKNIHQPKTGNKQPEKQQLKTTYYEH